ncbi:hypothetical protein A3Q56_07185, partial [Intoshia linei]
TNVTRAWDYKKPMICCLAANTQMYQHPITSLQMDIVENWGATYVPVVYKKLMCGESGPGGMASTVDIIAHLERKIYQKATQYKKMNVGLTMFTLLNTFL